VAAKSGHEAVVRLLLEHKGGRPAQGEGYGMTALIMAAVCHLQGISRPRSRDEQRQFRGFEPPLAISREIVVNRDRVRSAR
jgi:hypothetical protein